jgi:hypothetical protein
MSAYWHRRLGSCQDRKGTPLGPFSRAGSLVFLGSDLEVKEGNDARPLFSVFFDIRHVLLITTELSIGSLVGPLMSRRP